MCVAGNSAQDSQPKRRVLLSCGRPILQGRQPSRSAALPKERLSDVITEVYTPRGLGNWSQCFPASERPALLFPTAASVTSVPSNFTI